MKTEYSNYQPLYKLFFLYIFTFGLYFFWWHYKNLKQIKEANFDINFCKIYGKKYMSGQISPIPRTISLIVPILNLFIIYDLFKAIISYTEINKVDEDYTHSPSNYLIGFIAANIFYLGVIPILMIQHLFNKAWRKTDKRPIKKWPYISEWIFLILVPPFIFLFLIAAYINPTALLPTTYLEEVPQHIEDSCITYCVAFDNVVHYSLEYDYIEEMFSCYCLNNDRNQIASNSYLYSIE